MLKKFYKEKNLQYIQNEKSVYMKSRNKKKKKRKMSRDWFNMHNFKGADKISNNR